MTAAPANRIVSHSPEETYRIAGDLTCGLLLNAHNTVIALHGELGSGKTCFVQGVALALGIEQAVTSPTFTIVKEYVGKCPLYHVDLYRLAGPAEMLALGFDEYLGMDGIAAVEWAERAGELIPAHAVHVHLTPLDEPGERSIVIDQPSS